MATVINVTPAEYAEIKDASRRLNDPGFEAWMRERFGCRAYHAYHVKVRRDVPSIPWMVQGVYRFETERKAKG